MLRAFDKWLLPYLTAPSTSDDGVTDVMLAVCDHFEPFHHTDKSGALQRLATWTKRLPGLLSSFAGHAGVTPRHTFFYPIEQYDKDVIAALAELCAITGNEVEVHLHHDRDTADNLRHRLRQGLEELVEHKLLGRDAQGQPVFGFIHGNWALDDSGAGGHGCGVRGELAILRRAGCYADFTMPAAPNPAQARMVNSLYYSRSTPHGRSHDRGTRVEAGEGEMFREDKDTLLMVQGPLALEWRRRKWGLVPRIENADLTDNNPPSVFRFERWLQTGIAVAGQARWRFIKLHTHGGPERNHEVLLGEPARKFHDALLKYADARGIRLHYVSAREMVNVIHAAEQGAVGDAGACRNHVYAPPELLSHR